MGGIEPTNDGVKVHCLTTWLHPIIKNKKEKMGREGVEPPTP